MGVSKYGRTAVISVPETRVQRLSTQDWLTMINVSDACVTNRKGHYCWHALLWKTDHVITWCIWTMWQVVLWFSIRFMSLARLRQKKWRGSRIDSRDMLSDWFLHTPALIGRLHHRWCNNESWTNLWFRNSAFLIIIHLVLNYNGWASLGRWTSRAESIILSLLEELKKLSYSWWFNIPDFVRFLNLYSTGKPVICVYQNWWNWQWTYFTGIPWYSRSHPGWRFPWQKFSLSTFHNRC